MSPRLSPVPEFKMESSMTWQGENGLQSQLDLAVMLAQQISSPVPI